MRVASDVNDLRALIPPKTRIVSKIEKATALDDLRHKESEGSYFFSVNRFIFTAVKC